MRRGFTLVELSIVLVIIGLLIGGILVAQSMISSAKVVRLVSDLNSYRIATSNFHLNYKYFPGDDPYFDPKGDGNDGIGYGAAGNAVNCNGTYSNAENYQSFAHMVTAGMLKGTYVAWQPQNCGGTMGNSPGAGDISGIVMPYTENYASTLPTTKYPIIAYKGVTGLFYYELMIDPIVSLALPNKMETTDNNSTDGLYNDQGANNCFDGTGMPIGCGDPEAKYGHFFLQISQ